jgi:hypothetical protein
MKMNEEKTYKKFSIALLLVFSLVLLIYSCKKEVDLPDNPYDEIDYGDSLIITDTLDPNSITALHRDIFFPRCATPGCHDGNFEPNFLTVQSAYSTVVYQTLVKTDSNDYFIYRVHPYDTARSWIHERLITDDQTLGRMPLYGAPLSQDEMDRINTWIMNGAPDVNGNKASYPDAQPNILYYFATNELGSNSIVISGEDNRLNNISYNPFMVKPDSGFYVFVNVTDDSTSINQLTYNKLKLSKIRNDFSSATECSSNYFNTGGGIEYWYSYVSTAGYAIGDTVYLRFCTNDGEHVDNAEAPTNEDELYWHLYWSFYVMN